MSIKDNYIPLENISYYNFTAIFPANGHCEFQQFGPRPWIIEPANTLFAILTAALGVFGVISSKGVTVGTRYIFCLLLGYGLTSAAHTATLWNGFYKSSGGILNLMQSIIVVRFMYSLGYIRDDFSNFGTLVMSLFGIYPVVSIVLSSSFQNPWVGWLTFDLIWAVVLMPLVVVFLYWRNKDVYTLQYHLIGKSVVCCVVAYTFWLLDTFACSPWVAYLQSYGLWFIFMGCTFFYLTTIDSILQAQHQCANAYITPWPSKKFALFVLVNWGNDQKMD